MKLLILIFFSVAVACSEPRKVTFNPDDHAATSGTVGSAKATTQLPTATPDTSARRDSLMRKKDLR